MPGGATIPSGRHESRADPGAFPPGPPQQPERAQSEARRIATPARTEAERARGGLSRPFFLYPCVVMLVSP